jgi:hypothetical protein
MAMTLSPSSRWLYPYTNVAPIVAVNLVRCVLDDQSSLRPPSCAFIARFSSRREAIPSLGSRSTHTQHQQQHLQPYPASTLTPA